MKKIITSLSSAFLMLAASLSLTGVAKSAEFFTIGTGGPTGVYFQTGNAICKMLHKSAIAKEHGRKKGIDKAYRCTVIATGFDTNPSLSSIRTSMSETIEKPSVTEQASTYDNVETTTSQQSYNTQPTYEKTEPSIPQQNTFSQTQQHETPQQSYESTEQPLNPTDNQSNPLSQNEEDLITQAPKTSFSFSSILLSSHSSI